MAVMEHENLSLIVAETRWPSSVIDCEVDETLIWWWWRKGRRLVEVLVGFLVGVVMFYLLV
ncbi:unnamed protein product [Brassica oleracea]